MCIFCFKDVEYLNMIGPLKQTCFTIKPELK